MTRRARILSPVAASLLCLVVAACSSDIGGYEDERPQVPQADPEEGEGEEFSAFTYYNLPMGAWVKVCNVNYGLNNRSGPGTGYMVLRVLQKGTMVRTIKKSGNWYRVETQGKVGWSYGKYLCKTSSSSPSPGGGGSSSCHKGSKFGWSYCSNSCRCDVGEGDCDTDSECKPGLKCAHNVGASYGVTNTVDVCMKPSSSPPKPPKPSQPSPGGSGKINVSRSGIIAASKSFVGFSYWWGGAKLKPYGKDHGKCHSPTYGGHSGSWGADCSGFAAKVWQLPNAMPFESNKHPYSTYHFYNNKSYWSHISRSSAKEADAMVYRSGSGGHIVIYAGGSTWGKAWTYEARGCSYGVVYNLRTLSSSYRARRRSGI